METKEIDFEEIEKNMPLYFELIWLRFPREIPRFVFMRKFFVHHYSSLYGKERTWVAKLHLDSSPYKRTFLRYAAEMHYSLKDCEENDILEMGTIWWDSSKKLPVLCFYLELLKKEDPDFLFLVFKKEKSFVDATDIADSDLLYYAFQRFISSMDIIASLDLKKSLCEIKTDSVFKKKMSKAIAFFNEAKKSTDPLALMSREIRTKGS